DPEVHHRCGGFAWANHRRSRIGEADHAHRCQLECPDLNGLSAREPVDTLYRRFMNFHVFHLGGGRTFAKVADQAVNTGRIANGEDFDPTIASVADPSSDADLARPLNRPFAKEDSLDFTFNEDAARDHDVRVPLL